MMTSVNFRKILTVLLTVALMLSLISVVIGATEDTTAAVETTTAVEETTAAPEEITTAGDETTAAGDETTTAADETTAAGDDTTDDGLNWDLIISLSVIGLAIVVCVVLYFVLGKFRNWVNKFVREYKSELKKVVWSPWKDVRRNTLVVIIIVAAAALVIGLLDFIFSKGIISLGSLL